MQATADRLRFFRAPSSTILNLAVCRGFNIHDLELRLNCDVLRSSTPHATSRLTMAVKIMVLLQSSSSTEAKCSLALKWGALWLRSDPAKLTRAHASRLPRGRELCSFDGTGTNGLAGAPVVLVSVFGRTGIRKSQMQNI